MGNLFTITGHMTSSISLASRKLINFILKFFIIKRTIYVRTRDRLLLTVYVSSCHGVSFWNDVVL